MPTTECTSSTKTVSSTANRVAVAAAPAAPRPHRLLGAQLGDFLIQERIAKGSMGEVFLATQLSLDRKVAVKTVSSKIARNAEMVQRFLREMRWLAQLDHPQIVKVYAAGEHEKTPYAALEFVDGRNLQDWLNERKTLSMSDAVHVTLLCAEALSHAHSKGIVHRDVKPANILIGKLGEVKLTDFGLVKAAIEDVSLTSTGVGLGSPQYMAPEQIQDAKHSDARTDIYALGSTLYQQVTGKFPFPQTDLVDLLKAKLHGQITPAREINPLIPEKLNLVISKMLEKNPDFRYQTCQELVNELGSLGMARESLDFIESPNKVKVQRAWTNQAAVSVAAAVARLRDEGRSLRGSANSAPPEERPERRSKPRRPIAPSGCSATVVATEAQWFVRHKGAQGALVIHRMTTDEVLRGIETKYLDVNATAKADAKDPFRHLREFEPFQKLMDKRLSKCRVIRLNPRGARRWWSSRSLWVTLAAMLAAAAFVAWEKL
ncbi:MAG: serine/threonine-protein kinase [Planctomycetaceae bacterium]